LGLFANSHDTIDGVNAATEAANKEHLQNMGLMTGLAIFLHNFPEGLATFVAALADSRVGVALAVAIAVHNIPEGICVAMVRS
jgi:ZIP family zinc transporter